MMFDLQLGTDGDRRTLRGDRGAFGPHRFFKQDLVTYNFIEGQREQLLPPTPFTPYSAISPQLSTRCAAVRHDNA